MGRVRKIYTAEQRAEALQMLASGMSLAKVEEKTGISDGTLANWQERAKEDATQAQEASAKQQLDTVKQQLDNLKFKLQHVQLTNKYLKQLARAKSPEESKDIEIAYLRERLAKMFQDQWVKPLSELDDDDEDDAGTTEG